MKSMENASKKTSLRTLKFNHHVKTANVITGIVSSLAVGATIGILFAPDKDRSKTHEN